MTIKKADPEHHIILSDIAFKGKAYWNYDFELLNSWRENLTLSKDYIKENKVYVVCENEKIIAFYSLLHTESTTYKIDFLFMYPEFIGRGIGKLLLEHSIQIAKTNSIKRIILDADPNAERFYCHFGFTTYAKLESSIKDRFLPQMELLL